MGSTNTTLCLVNFSGKRIKSTVVQIDDPGDWDHRATEPGRNHLLRPDLNFTGPLDNNSSRCEREEINSATEKGCWFWLTLTFDDDSTIKFRVNQWDAKTKLSGRYTDSLQQSSQNAHLEIYRTTGEDRYTYTNAFYIRPANPPDNSAWMGKLLSYNSTLRLDEITMPGSHDAGMCVKASEQAVTQHLSIFDQLKAGSRYFDLRVCKTDGELWTYHGPTYGAKLSDILDDVRRFLTPGSREVVFLKFRSHKTGDREDTVNLVKSKLENHLYKAAFTPNFATEKLMNLMGHVVAVFTPDYASLLDPRAGIFPYSDYGNEDTGCFIPHNDDRCLGVYDAYSHRSEFELMTKDQHNKCGWYGGYNKQYLFLFSWTLTGSTDNVLDLDLLSSTANPQLPKALHALAASAAQKGLPNIVYMDEVDPWLCSAIVAVNPCMQKGGKTGDLYWHAHAGWQTGAALFGAKIGEGGWTGFRSVFATSEGVLYAIDWYGNLNRYRDVNWQTGGAPSSFGGGEVVGEGGWGTYTSVFASSSGVLYAIDSTGKLWRYRDTSWRQGKASVGSRTRVDAGWEKFTAAFATSDGVLYAIDSIGKLWRYRDPGDGKPWAGVQISSGWERYKSVFATSNGVIYAITHDGNLDWYQDTGWQSGDGSVGDGRTVGAGWADFRIVFATSEGRLYGIKA